LTVDTRHSSQYGYTTDVAVLTARCYGQFALRRDALSLGVVLRNVRTVPVCPSVRSDTADRCVTSKTTWDCRTSWRPTSTCKHKHNA